MTHTGADEGTRTLNLLITNQLLCQLSYVSRADFRETFSIISDVKTVNSHVAGNLEATH